MQNLDVISVNLWQILISLLNLTLLFFILKKFLFKPVQSILEKRQNELSRQYEAAQEAEDSANESREKWETTLAGAKSEADRILATATENARFRSDKIISEAEARAEVIVNEAKAEAALTEKKAKDVIRTEIVTISGQLTEKLLAREINEDDHRAMIDAFLEEMDEA